jgi:hypothetical protein
VRKLLEQPGFREIGSDRRFDAVMGEVGRAEQPGVAEAVRNRRGEPVVRFEQVGRVLRVVVDDRLAPGLGAFLMEHMHQLVQRFDDDRERT